MDTIKEPLPGNLLPLQPQELDNSTSRNVGYGSHAQGLHAALEESRWQRNVDTATLSTARPWQSGLAALPSNFLRQILGLNPFKTSYFALYRPLKDFQSRTILVLGVILAIAAGVPLPIIGVVFGKIINNFPPTEDELITRLSQLMGIAAAYFVLTWGWAVCWGIIGEKVSRGLRESLVERALGMEMSFYDTEAPDMTTVLTDKTQTVQLGTSEKVGLFVQSMSYFVAAFTVGFILDAQLTGILFAGVIPTMAIIVCSGTHIISRMSKKAAACSEQAANVAESAIRAVQVVQAFGISQSLAEDYISILKKGVRYGIRKSLAGAGMLGLVYFTAYGANALAFWEGRRLQESRSGPDAQGSAGTIYAVVFLILDASFVVGQFGPFIQTFALAAAAGSSIFEILDHPEAHIDVYSDEGNKVSKEDIRKDIEFRDVIFVYPARPAVRVLDSLSIRLKSGAVNGVVGSSGSGKSTLASLLVRLYDPTSGQIAIGSKDVRSFNVAELRKHIAVVEQDSVLFSGTILDNIAFGLPDSHTLDETEMRARCLHSLKEAHCDFVDVLPDGILTVIGGKGSTQLSGGQKQRLCLARALVRNPALLILDEYTSAMDATSESIVLEALRRGSREYRRTTVVIAHRLATVKDADNILVLTDGSLVEEGTHEDLISNDGVYAGLVRAQGFEKRGSLSRKTSAETSLTKSTSMGKTTKLPTEEPTAAEIGGESKKKLSALTLIRRCLSLSKPESPLIVLGLLASTVSGAIIVGEAIVFGNLVSLLNSPRTPETNKDANFFSLMFFVLALIALFAYTTSGSLFGIVSEKLILRVQYISLQTILSQDMSWFSKPGNSPHLLMSKLSMDAGHLGGLSGVILGTFFSVFTTICGGLILAHVVAWRIAVVLLAAVPVMVLAGFLRLKVLAKAEERHQSAYGDAAATASEACAAIRTVAILGREQTFLTKYKDQVRKPYKQGMKFTLTANILLAFSLSITYFVYALAYWWGAQQVRKGYYSVLDFFIVLPALLFSAQAAGQMFSLSPEITRAQTAAQSIFTLHAQKPTIMQALDPKSSGIDTSDTEDGVLEKKGMQGGSIHFQNISLAYSSRPDTLALNNVSLTIPAGSFVAFVGRSGAGKTSSIALIERFFDPVSGKVLIDGEDIRTMPIEQHRARVSLVEQEPDLFPGSIRHNVALGARPGETPTTEEIEKVCKMCGLHTFIMSLPDAYNTDCGRNGNQLSGGQRQRIAIARALIRNPDILLLDEATSQLDANTEQELRKAIAAASAGRTTVMVAHRLSSIQRADCIYVFDHGKVLEQGTHDELVEQGGIYAGMVAAQELS